MDRANKGYIERQVHQLLRRGNIDQAGSEALLRELGQLDDALAQAEDLLDVFRCIATTGFAANQPAPRSVRVVLPSCGGLPVTLALPTTDGGTIKYANKQKLLA